jgi:hypothetical protein
MHYKTRANVYMVLGRCVCVVTVLVSAIVRIWGGVSRVVKSSVVALVFGFGMDLCQT